MKLRDIISAGAIGLFVMTAGCTSNKAPTPETGKAMDPLPDVIEGVERTGDTLRKKPGFGWVKQPDGTIMLRRQAETGDGGDVIRVGCGCDTGPHACEAVLINDDTIKCQTKGDCLSCKFFKPKDIGPGPQ